jgi:hypothetical protein
MYLVMSSEQSICPNLLFLVCRPWTHCSAVPIIPQRIAVSIKDEIAGFGKVVGRCSPLPNRLLIFSTLEAASVRRMDRLKQV